MSERVSEAPKDVQEAKTIKLWLAVFSFVVAGVVAIAGVFVGFSVAIYSIVTVFIGAGSLLLDVPIVKVIREIRVKDGS